MSSHNEVGRMDNSAITAAVKQLREIVGDTQQRFANRLGLAVSSVARYDAGKKPDTPVLLKLADVAEQCGHRELSAVFYRAVNDEIGHVAYREATNVAVGILKAITESRIIQ